MSKNYLFKLGKISIPVIMALALNNCSIKAINNQPRKEWKVSAYLDGDSNIDFVTFWNLNQLEKIGSNEVIDIYAQLDRAEVQDYKLAPEDPFNIFRINNEFGTRRYYILKDDNMLKIESKEIPDFSKELNMGAYKTFEDFVKWVEQYNLKKHLFIIKGHGFGIMIPLHQILSNYGKRSNEIDDALPTYTINDVFNKQLKNRLEIIIFDSCEKATIEVAYQLRNHAKAMIASENLMYYDVGFDKDGSEKVHLPGIAYDEILKYIKQNPRVDTKELEEFIVDSYFEIFNNNLALENISATLSAIDLRKVNDLVENFAIVSNTLIDQLENEKTRNKTIETLKQALKETQHYDTPDALNLYAHIDLFDFLKRIYKNCDNKRLKKEITRTINKSCIIKSRYKGEDVKDSNGLSILFIKDVDKLDSTWLINNKKMKEHIMEYYAESDFAKKTNWSKVMELYQKFQ